MRRAVCPGPPPPARFVVQRGRTQLWCEGLLYLRHSQYDVRATLYSQIKPISKDVVYHFMLFIISSCLIVQARLAQLASAIK